MEKKYNRLNFNDLISLLLDKNIESIDLNNIRQENTLIDYSLIEKKIDEIKEIFIHQEERNFYYEILDYSKKQIFIEDIKKIQMSLSNIVQLVVKSILIISISFYLFIKNFSLNLESKELLFCIVSLSGIYFLLNLLINNKEKITKKLLKYKIDSIDNTKKRKLLVLFLLNDKNLLGGEKMFIFNKIVTDDELYIKIKKIVEKNISEKELNQKILNFMMK